MYSWKTGDTHPTGMLSCCMSIMTVIFKGKFGRLLRRFLCLIRLTVRRFKDTFSQKNKHFRNITNKLSQNVSEQLVNENCCPTHSCCFSE